MNEQQRHIDYLVKLAEQNVCEGVIQEPRVYYDIIQVLPNFRIAEGAADVFVNGEQFPVRITHLSTAIRPDFQGAVGLDERFLQRVGLRLTFHDQFYMSRDFAAAPLWLNKPVAAADLVTQGTSSWVFDRPWILSARDSVRVQVALETIPTTPRLVSVAFTGVGLLSKRPYFLSDDVSLADANPTVLQTDRFRNDGTEPIAICEMTVHCGAEEEDPVGQGDIRRLRINVRQVGNGTQADWAEGPTVPAPITLCPASLWGYTTGRAIVHCLPGDGLLWEPGEGITVEVQGLDDSADDLDVGISVAGYISVT